MILRLQAELNRLVGDYWQSEASAVKQFREANLAAGLAPMSGDGGLTKSLGLIDPKIIAPFIGLCVAEGNEQLKDLKAGLEQQPHAGPFSLDHERWLQTAVENVLKSLTNRAAETWRNKNVVNALVARIGAAGAGYSTEIGHQFPKIRQDFGRRLQRLKAKLIAVKLPEPKPTGQRGTSVDELAKRLTSVERQQKKPAKPLTKLEKIRKQRNDFSCKRRTKKTPDTWGEIYNAYNKKYPKDKDASPDTLRLSHDRNCTKCLEDKS